MAKKLKKKNNVLVSALVDLSMSIHKATISPYFTSVILVDDQIPFVN